MSSCALLPAVPPKGICTKPKKVEAKAISLEEDSSKAEDSGKE